MSLYIYRIFFNPFRAEEHNSLDSKKKGKTILITGPIKSGKTFLFQKVNIIIDNLSIINTNFFNLIFS